MEWRKFIIERELPRIDLFERTPLHHAAAKLAEGLRDLGPDARWIQNHEADDKTYSVYLAKDEYVLRRHVEMNGFPAASIREIATDAMLGTVSVVRGTKDDGSTIEPRLFFSTGAESFQLDENGPIGAAELLLLERDRLVLVRGSMVGGLLAIGDVQVLATVSRHIRQAVGTLNWVVLLCRFADSVGAPPESADWFKNVVTASHPGLQHFFKDISYGSLTTPVDVVGWRTLPGKRTDYPHDENDLLAGCTGLYPDVLFTAYYGVIMVIDGSLTNAAGLGAGRETTIHGNQQFWGLVWLGTAGWRHPRIWAQEIGHTFGLKHTLVRSSPILRSGWDFMGTVTTCLDTFQGGCLAQHTTGYHKDRLGWLDLTRSVRVTATVGRLRIASLSNPDDQGFLYVEVAIPGETQRHYGVEARSRSGYDNNIPGTAPASAIVIHEIDLNRNPESYTVDHGEGATNGPGGAWSVGESFIGDGVQIDVLDEVGTGFEIRVLYAPRPPHVRLEYAGCSFGSVRFVPSWSAQPDDIVTSVQADIRYAGGNWVPLLGPTVISANSNQRVYLRARACNSLGCSSYASVSAKEKCVAHPH